MFLLPYMYHLAWFYALEHCYFIFKACRFHWMKKKEHSKNIAFGDCNLPVLYFDCSGFFKSSRLFTNLRVRNINGNMEAMAVIVKRLFLYIYDTSRFVFVIQSKWLDSQENAFIGWYFFHSDIDECASAAPYCIGYAIYSRAFSSTIFKMASPAVHFEKKERALGTSLATYHNTKGSYQCKGVRRNNLSITQRWPNLVS